MKIQSKTLGAVIAILIFGGILGASAMGLWKTTSVRNPNSIQRNESAGDPVGQLTGNDLLDFHHAEAAMGYCNLFLTEKPLKALVSQHHLGLMRDFHCAVETSASGALGVLNNAEYQ